MTVSSSTSSVSYSGNGATTGFSYTFKIFADSDLVVSLKNNTTGVSTTQTLTTDYTVSGAGSDSGGNVTFVTAPPSGNTVIIRRVLPYTQETDYTENDPFPAQAHEDALDKLTMLAQQNRDEDAIKLPEGDVTSGINNVVPNVVDRANTLLGFDATGNVIVEPFTSSSLTTSITQQSFTGNGSTTAFTLASNPGAAGIGVSIYIDGLYQERDTYSISSTTLTFTEAPPDNASIEVLNYRVTDIGTADANNVTYSPNGSGAVQTTVQTKLRESVSVKDFGAVGDGVADDTAAIQAALTYATPSSSTTFVATGGKSVHLPAGKYKISGELSIPAFVNLIGEGKGLSTIVCSTSGSKVKYGERSTDNRGGLSKGFTIDGNDVSTNPMFIGLAVEREFSDIDVINSAGDGLIIEAAQNCVFTSCGFQFNGSAGSGSNIAIDYGAGNNRFIGCEINQGAQNNVRFRQTGTSPTGAFTVPTQNRFYGCMIERYKDESNFNGTIYQGNGRLNKFDKCDISCTGVTSTANLPLVRMERTVTGKASGLLSFDSCSFAGSASYTTVFDGQGASGAEISAQFTGYNLFENHSKVFRLNDHVIVDIEKFQDSSGGTFFTALGSKTQDQLVQSKITDVMTNLVTSAAGSAAQQIGVDGESNPRFIFRPNGINAGSGSGSTDVVFSRGTAAGVPCWTSSGPIKISNTAAIVVAGSGAPTIGSSNGSIYLRTDGSGTNDNLYVRRGGAWVGIA